MPFYNVDLSRESTPRPIVATPTAPSPGKLIKRLRWQRGWGWDENRWIIPATDTRYRIVRATRLENMPFIRPAKPLYYACVKPREGKRE